MNKLGYIVAATAAVVFASVANAAPRLAADYQTATYSGPRGTVATAGSRSTGQTGIGALTLGPIYSAGGFESYADGNLIGQNTWAKDNGAGVAVNYTVGAATGAGGTKGVTVSGIGTEFAYPTYTAATPTAGQGVSVNIDLARTVAATAATSSARYGVDVYTTTFSRVTQFGLTRNATTNALGLYVVAPFNTVTGQFQAGQPVFVVTISGALAANTYFNIEGRMNYDTKTVDIYSGNTLFLGNIPFATATAANFGEADLTVATGTGLDQGLFDNLTVTGIAVPEPTTLGALAGIGAIVARRRRA